MLNKQIKIKACALLSRLFFYCIINLK